MASSVKWGYTAANTTSQGGCELPSPVVEPVSRRGCSLSVLIPSPSARDKGLPGRGRGSSTGGPSVVWDRRQTPPPARPPHQLEGHVPHPILAEPHPRPLWAHSQSEPNAAVMGGAGGVATRGSLTWWVGVRDGLPEEAGSQQRIRREAYCRQKKRRGQRAGGEEARPGGRCN